MSLLRQILHCLCLHFLWYNGYLYITKTHNQDIPLNTIEVDKNPRVCIS